MTPRRADRFSICLGERLVSPNDQVNRRPATNAPEKRATHAGVRLNAMLGRRPPRESEVPTEDWKLRGGDEKPTTGTARHGETGKGVVHSSRATFGRFGVDAS